jgi:hypothetical protein
VSDDICERIAAVINLGGDTYSSYEVIGMLAESKAEIERLRAELSVERGSQISAVNAMLKVEQENERLRARLEECPVIFEIERLETIARVLGERELKLAVENERLRAALQGNGVGFRVEEAEERKMSLHSSTFTYLKPTEDQINNMGDLRAAAAGYALALEACLPDGPDKTYCLRKLREVAMWANVAVTREADGSPRGAVK